MISKNNFVVYAYSREDWTFYYIGKGRPDRPYSPHRKVKKPDNVEHIHILHSGLDNKTAVEYEKSLILFYGRKDSEPEWGILRNMTDGGEGTHGYIFTESHKENISKALKGKRKSKEHAKNISESKKGDKNPMYGKTISEEQKKIKSEKWKGSNNPNWGRVYTEEERLRMSEQRRGEKGSFFGKKHSEETIKKLSRPRKVKNPKYYHWFHPLIGEVHNKTIGELIHMYRDHNLSRGNLRKVVRGVISNHRGWRTISSPI